MTTTLISIGGLCIAAALGASIRVLCIAHLNGPFPTGTLIINLVASFGLGMLVNAEPPWDVVIGVGALGALSTWSSVANDVGALARQGEGPLALAFLVCTVATSILAAWVGLQLAPAMW